MKISKSRRIPLSRHLFCCMAPGTLAFALQAAPVPPVLLSDSIVDDKALTTPVGTNFAGVMNGQAFQNDIPVSHNGWQYAAWCDTASPESIGD